MPKTSLPETHFFTPTVLEEMRRNGCVIVDIIQKPGGASGIHRELRETHGTSMIREGFTLISWARGKDMRDLAGIIEREVRGQGLARKTTANPLVVIYGIHEDRLAQLVPSLAQRSINHRIVVPAAQEQEFRGKYGPDAVKR